MNLQQKFPACLHFIHISNSCIVKVPDFKLSHSGDHVNILHTLHTYKCISPSDFFPFCISEHSMPLHQQQNPSFALSHRKFSLKQV